MIKAEFSASLLQSSVLHDPSEIITIYRFFRIIWWIESKKQQQCLFEIGMFCNIVNVFIVTFCHFNAFLLYINIYLSKFMNCDVFIGLS